MFSLPPEFWVVVFGLLGAILGSYVNMAAYRLPRGISTITRTRSFCPSCQHELAWFNNVPILSYLLLRGRCHYCGRPIGVRYLLTELIVAGLFALAAWQFFVLNHSLDAFITFQNWSQPPIVFAVQLFLMVDLVLLSIVDLETWLIPLHTTIPGIALGLVLAPFFPALHPGATGWIVSDPNTIDWTGADRLNALLDSFQGLVLGGGLLWAVGFLTTLLTFCYFKLRGIPARPKEGMGAGDCHLMAMVGALLGWKAAVATIFIGVLLGTFTGVGKVLWGKFQHWRLQERWHPWQPTYDLPTEEEGGGAGRPSFWPLAVMGLLVLAVVIVLFQLSARSFNGQIFQTLGERHAVVDAPRREWLFDVRLVSAYVMLLVGLLLLAAFPFYWYLARMDLLPQGDVVEKESGEKEEVIQGNYIPFGPALALAALLVACYDPLIRAFALWFFNGAMGPFNAPLPYHLAGEEGLRAFLQGGAHAFNGLVRWLVGVE